MAATLVAPQPDGLSEVLNFGGQDSIVDASVVVIEGKELELETTDNDRVASPTGEKFESNAPPPLSDDSDDVNPEPSQVVEEEAPLGQVATPDVVETDKEVIAKDIPLDNESSEEVSTHGTQDTVLIDVLSKESEAVASPAVVAPLPLPQTDLLTPSPSSGDPELESLVPADPASANVDVQASSPIDQGLSPVLAPTVPSVISEEAIVEQIDTVVEDVPVHVDEISAPSSVVGDESPSLTAVEQPTLLDEVHVLPKGLDHDVEQAILQQDTPTTNEATPVPEEAISLSSVQEAEIPVTVEESLEAAADPLLKNELQEIIPVAQAAVESAEFVKVVMDDPPVESVEHFAGTQDIISSPVDGTQGFSDEGVTLQDPEEVDSAVNEPVVEVSTTQEDDFAVSGDLQTSVADEESSLETGIEATVGSEGSQVVGSDSEDVAPAPLIIPEAEPVDDLPSVENAPASVIEEDVPVAVAKESLEIPVEVAVITKELEFDDFGLRSVEVGPLVKEEAEPKDDLSTADGASETVVEVALPRAASDAETPSESTTSADQEVGLVTEAEPQADTVEANAVESDSVGVAAEAPPAIEEEEPAVAGNANAVENDSVGVAADAPLAIEEEEAAVARDAPESVEDDVKPFIEESLADTPVVVDSLGESISMPDQEVLPVLENDAEVGVEQTEVLEESSADVAEAALVIEETGLTDEVANTSETVIDETLLEATVEESSAETPAEPLAVETPLTIKDTEVEPVNAEENQVPALAVIQDSESLVSAENAFPPAETLVVEQVPDDLLPESSSEEVGQESVQSLTVLEGSEPTLESAVVEDHPAPVEDVTPEVIEESTPLVDESGADAPAPDIISLEATSVEESSTQQDAASVPAQEAEVTDTSSLGLAVEEVPTTIEDASELTIQATEEEQAVGTIPAADTSTAEITSDSNDVLVATEESPVAAPEPSESLAIPEDPVPPVEPTGPAELLSESSEIQALEENAGEASTSFEDQPPTNLADAVVSSTTADDTLPPTEDSADVEEAAPPVLEENAAQPTDEVSDVAVHVEDVAMASIPAAESFSEARAVEILEDDLSTKPSHADVHDEDQPPTNLADAVVSPTTADDTLPPTEDSADVEEAAPNDEVSDVAVLVEDVATASIPAAESPSEARVVDTLEDDLSTKPSLDIVIPDESSQASEHSFTSTEAEQPLLTPASQIERPKSPWTPSYSVTSQGPGLTAEEDISDNEISDVEDVKEVPVVSVTPGEEFGDTVPDPLVSAGERPKSPWTPSYSVSVQGSPMQPAAELKSVEISEENADDVSHLTLIDSEAPVPVDVSVTHEGITSADIVVADVQSSSTEAFEVLDDAAQLESAEDTQPLDSLQASESVDVSKSETDIEIKDAVPETFSDAVQPETIEDSHVVDLLPTAQHADEPAYVVGVEGDIKDTAPVELDVVEPEESTATSEIPSVGVVEEELDAAGATEASTGEDVEEEFNAAGVTETLTGEDIAKEINVEALDKPEFLDAPQVERPWTPSYSVTQQGPGTPEPSSELAAENEGIEKSILADSNAIEEVVEPFAPKAIHASLAGINESQLLNAETTREIERPWTPSYSVLQQGPGTPLVEKTDLLEPVTVADPADVKSSAPEHSLVAESSPSLWTPSYSVTSQGTPSPKPHTLEVESDDKLEPLPSASDSAPFPAAVDDDAQSVVTSLDTIDDKPTSRARLESTTSSRFFPGGWFAKPQPEGRTSTDNAQGEFIPSKPQTETQQPSTNDPAPITTDSEEISSDDSDEEDEDEAKAKKGRWCVVM